jgi:ferredoxin
MPCSHAPSLVEHLQSADGANDQAVVHLTKSGIDKRGGAHPARCCTSICSLCNAPLAAGSDEQPRPVLVKHRLDGGDRVAGIFVGQPHGPPRS